MLLDFNIRIHDKFTILDFPAEEINFIIARSLKSKLKDLIGLGHKNIILNLSRVTYIDSTVLGIIISIHKACLTEGGELRLCNLTSDIEIIFYLTGVDNFLKIFTSEQDAIQAKATGTKAIKA